jgi:hypothetical protein
MQRVEKHNIDTSRSQNINIIRRMHETTIFPEGHQYGTKTQDSAAQGIEGNLCNQYFIHSAFPSLLLSKKLHHSRECLHG